MSRGGRINWSRVEALSRFGGIRIEDDLAVTRGGCENLTRDAFRPKPVLSGGRADSITSETNLAFWPAYP